MVPALNQDGLAHVQNQTFIGNHDVEVLGYTKNMKKSGQCSGVNLRNNYDLNFGMDNRGSSSAFCDHKYRGEEAFSEFETKAVKNFVDHTFPVGFAH